MSCSVPLGAQGVEATNHKNVEHIKLSLEYTNGFNVIRVVGGIEQCYQKKTLKLGLGFYEDVN